MSRLDIAYPWDFTSMSGPQSTERLMDNFNAVPEGVITIKTQVLAGSYQLITDDEYSFFLCVPTNDMTLSPPLSVDTNYSFFVSNQHTSTSVVLQGSWTIEGEEVTDPSLPGTFGGVNDVRGGLAVWDGSTWSLYPRLFIL